MTIFGVATRRLSMLLHTLTNTLRQWQLLVLLFLLTLLPALPTALAFFGTLNTETARSLAPLQMLPTFNYTVFADFMHEHGKAVWPLIRAGWWTAVLSLLLSVWAKGGILYSIAHGFSAGTFWQAGTRYFNRNGRLLGITALFVAIWLIVFLLTGVLTALFLDEGLGDPFSERGYVAIAVLVSLVFGLVLIRILCASQYASVLMYERDETVAFRAFSQGWRFVGQHRAATFGRYLLLIGIGTLLLLLYLWLESGFEASNWLLIGLLFGLQQAFVFSRTALIVWSLQIASANIAAFSQPENQVFDAPVIGAPTPSPTDAATPDEGRLVE